MPQRIKTSKIITSNARELFILSFIISLNFSTLSKSYFIITGASIFLIKPNSDFATLTILSSAVTV